MKFVKIILIILTCVIALPLIVAVFIPRKYTISVTESINQPKEVVYDYIRMLKNQKEYSVWVMADPELNPEITGTDGTVGAIQKWNSKDENVGEGEQEITRLTPDRMDVDLRFKRPFEGSAKAAHLFRSLSPDLTEVTAEFYSDSKYPMNLMSYVFGKKIMEKALGDNLKNIKKNLERG